MPATAPESVVRPVLGPGGNRIRSPVSEAKRRPATKKPPPVAWSSPESGSRCNSLPLDRSCSSDSSGSMSPVRTGSLRKEVRRPRPAVKPVEVAMDGLNELAPPVLPMTVAERKRCAWITANSDPLYISFHDEEWGVPVRDDRKLFELLVLTEAFGELSWATVLSKRDLFRKMFDNFDAASVAQFSEKEILSLKENGNVLSEPKLRAVVENAKQIVKIVEEVGSFSKYCWNFVNHKPVVNGFRYPRQVPVKTPKADVISKDMMRRGFRYVGPTIIYSFMQATGIVNDHLISCFRHKECNSNIGQSELNVEQMDTLVKAVEEASL